MQSGGAKKSIIWAYVCWLFGGIFGLHLFYLERDAHAFLTWSTLGGYGLGWLADVTKIPRYVRDCNDDPKFLEELSERMRRNRKDVSKFSTEALDDTFLLIKVAIIFGPYDACRSEELRKLNVEDIEDTGYILVVSLHDTKTKKKCIFTVNTPPFSTSRFISSVMVGYLWGQLVMMAIPEDEIIGINWKVFHWTIPLAVSFGVWIVGNIGRERGKPWLTMFASYTSYILRWYFPDENVWLTVMVFSAALTFDTFSKQWRRTPRQKKGLARRMSILLLCAMLYVALWSSYFYFNGKIIDSNGDEVPVHEAIHHFFTSPWWTDLKQSLYDTYQYAQHHGWYEIWRQIIALSDPQGEQNSYKVLGVGPSSSQSEITAKWRALSREWHPDKVKDPEQRKIAQEKFMEIQQAYEILSNIKSKRRRKNKKSINED